MRFPRCVSLERLSPARCAHEPHDKVSAAQTASLPARSAEQIRGQTNERMSSLVYSSVQKSVERKNNPTFR
ncbi:Hypothetical protein SMAX5B_017008 [Scophthalmus maximus]|uniref:Uncharacterized protein n=1 Tax=Scophthalmus maximus TaxID=52904 RepID=A0A2U9BA70_SCOMX|nr:Hypothetical protein SMAX5B_017008 [Scophthalmus maximus]